MDVEGLQACLREQLEMEGDTGAGFLDGLRNYLTDTHKVHQPPQWFHGFRYSSAVSWPRST